MAVRDAGFPYKTRLWERHDGTVITTAQECVLSDGDADLDPIGIRRSSLQKVLYKYASSTMGIRTNFNKPLASAWEQEDGLIMVKFGDGTSRLTKVLFGADGALGKSRAIVAQKENPKLAYTGVTCLMGLSNCPREGITFPSSDQDDFHAVFFPTGQNEQCFQFHQPIPEEDANQLNWGNLSDEVGQEECRKIAAELREKGWHERYIEPLEHCVRAVRVGFALLEPRLKSWVRGKMCLVGDAAHPPVPYVGQGAQQGLEDAGVVVSLLKIYCLNEETGEFDTTDFEKAMKLYQEIRIQRSSQILDFSKSLGVMQSRRSGTSKAAKEADKRLKGDVLMYGTLPCMVPGAGHDYKDDIVKATTKHELPAVNVNATMEALDYLLGGGEIVPDNCPGHNTPAFLPRIEEEEKDYSENDEERERIGMLTEWIADVMEHVLQQIVAHHNAMMNAGQLKMFRAQRRMSNSGNFKAWKEDGAVVDEVQEIIELPDFSPELLELEEDPDSIVLPSQVKYQLKSFVANVASLYRNNPFHNYEHAVHVTMSVYKLLTRMIEEKGPNKETNTGDETFGIASDPITLFACVLAALIHDADHQGVPNAQLLNEHPHLQDIYHGKAAIAEQHSINVGWEMLMDSKYKAFRDTICVNEDEMKRFRQLIVNIIMATDICDKDLKEFRNMRWEKAFSEDMQRITSYSMKWRKENHHRKATIGLEQLIQVSDVSHTMQPWHVYR